MAAILVRQFSMADATRWAKSGKVEEIDLTRGSGLPGQAQQYRTFSVTNQTVWDFVARWIPTNLVQEKSRFHDWTPANVSIQLSF